MYLLIAIGGGGALGALLRHFVNNALATFAGGAFPWGIFAINIAGSLAMGCLISLFAHVGEPPQAMKAFLTVGVLGAFTTFSTFSMDAVTLLSRGDFGAACFYVLGSVVLAIGGLYAGIVLVRLIAS